jgi:hypothetical protein
MRRPAQRRLSTAAAKADTLPFATVIEKPIPRAIASRDRYDRAVRAPRASRGADPTLPHALAFYSHSVHTPPPCAHLSLHFLFLIKKVVVVRMLHV